MKLNFDNFKEKFNNLNLNKFKDNAKTFFENNYKMIGSAVVVTALCAVCTVNAVNNVSANNAGTGVIITVSDVADKSNAFSGAKFETASFSYNEMKSVNYEAEQLASIEKSEKQVDEVLSSKRQDKKDQAALNALTAQETTEAPEVTTPAKEPEVVVTYADENGTYVSAGDFVLTAYCPCSICCGVYSNMENPTTASGTTATAGRTIAADTSVLPFGTQVVINGQIYTVEDRGGAIRGNRIDIFFNSHQDALQFGRRVATVYVVQ